MSLGWLIRPSGIVLTNFARSSGVSPPMNMEVRPVSPSTGQIALTRIRSGASSTAIAFEMVIAAPYYDGDSTVVARFDPKDDALVTLAGVSCGN